MNGTAGTDPTPEPSESIFLPTDRTLPPPPPPTVVAPQPRPKLIAGLFLATCVSCFLTYAGTTLGGDALSLVFAAALGAVPADQLRLAGWQGLQYAACVMAILLAHEMGHYLQALWNRVPASPPFFIPMPLGPFGTMGAVIVQRGLHPNRRVLFDVAVSGPLAGLVFAVPLCVWGLTMAHVAPLPEGSVTQYGDPLLLKWLAARQFGPIPAGHDVILNPVLFAGWVGIFITALNLVPIGQLDGGHLLYALLGRRARGAANVLWWLAVVVVAYASFFTTPLAANWILMLGLVRLIGVAHPPTLDDSVPLGPFRTVLGWATLAFLIIGFTPLPILQMGP